MTSPIKWRIESLRIVAVCGDVEVGAIFPACGTLKTRWRMWITEKPNLAPVDGVERNDSVAQEVVVNRFALFLKKANLQPIPASAS